jgi:hypothetical protein
MLAAALPLRVLSLAAARLRSAARLTLLAATVSGQVLLSGHVHPPALKAAAARTAARVKISALTPQAPDCPLCALTAQLRSIHAGAPPAPSAFVFTPASEERGVGQASGRRPSAPSARGPPRALPPPRPRTFVATMFRPMNDAGERR